MIQTVTGSLDEKKVKNTLAHEHFVFGKPGIYGDMDNCYDRETAFHNGSHMLKKAGKYDVNLIVDATTIERGRDPFLLKTLSEKTGIYVVCATGFFKDEGELLAFLKSLTYCCDIEEYLKELFVSEIKNGIGSTGVKAGVIKAASSLKEIKPLERMILSAGAEAQKVTGVPLLTHCERGTMGIEQTELLLSRGVNPGKVVIGHMSSSHDMKEVKRIMDKGVYAAFDQFGILSIPEIPSDEEKMEHLLVLLEEGYEDSIVISHDCCFDRMGYVSQSKPRYPDMIFKTVIPFLRRNGISDRIIRKITRDNLLNVFRQGEIRCEE
ncbi:phosphotriesterase family protein [Anaerostipes sp.]|uniref:phosphotriesterase family protein n=1 Tax=Anaerostipes sp. TaxID=1872530 RepID=UPI0025BAAEF5|nr:hypothetical protein [Anaerostipes sp.]MBS7009432.1 hypothetical protein [Anaerostipes sp.]